MNQLMALILIPDAVKFDNLPDAVKLKFQEYGVSFHDIAKTKVVNDIRPILGDLTQPDSMTVAEFETAANALVSAYGLTWDIIGLQDFKAGVISQDEEGEDIYGTVVHKQVPQSFIDTYVVQDPIVDEDGVFQSWKPVTGLNALGGARAWVMP